MEKFFRLPNIPVPADAYKFVAALDRLIGQLPVQKPANSGLQKMAIIVGNYLSIHPQISFLHLLKE
jgi:hypothetical protein